jgi:hypothetical protein
LARAQLTAVPDNGWLDAASGRFVSETNDLALPCDGQGPPRIDVRADRIAVVNQKKSQGSRLKFS